MNDSKNSSNGLLVLRIPKHIGMEAVEKITPLAESMGLEPMVLDGGADARIENGSSALLERICVALEALVAQGQPPELSEPLAAPQALNARPTGLNSRPSATCRGDWALGTACGHCSRCDATRHG